MKESTCLNFVQRFKLTIAYHGKFFQGMQAQPSGRTVQQTLEKTLTQILGEPIKITASGRTDSGVHALAQVCHFTVQNEKGLGRIRAKNFLIKLNQVLPLSLTATNLKKVSPEFHAQKQAKTKTYVYFLLCSRKKNPFVEDFVWRVKKPLSLKAMKKAKHSLIGKHDFKAFCASDHNAKTTERKLVRIKIEQKCPAVFFKLPGENYICLEFTGTGFLKQMVRIIVGTLVAVGEGKLAPEDLKTILAAKDRRLAPRTAPAQGLFLKKVYY